MAAEPAAGGGEPGHRQVRHPVAARRGERAAVGEQGGQAKDDRHDGDEPLLGRGAGDGVLHEHRVLGAGLCGRGFPGVSGAVLEPGGETAGQAVGCEG